MSKSKEELLKKSSVPISENILVINNAFPNHLHKKIYNELVNSQNWGFLQTSNSQNNEIKFWINVLGGWMKKANVLRYSPFYEKELFSIVTQLTMPFLKEKYNCLSSLDNKNRHGGNQWG